MKLRGAMKVAPRLSEEKLPRDSVISGMISSTLRAALASLSEPVSVISLASFSSSSRYRSV